MYIEGPSSGVALYCILTLTDTKRKRYSYKASLHCSLLKTTRNRGFGALNSHFEQRTPTWSNDRGVYRGQILRFSLNPADCNDLAGTDALENALGFPGWLHPYNDVLRWSQQQLRETWSITTMKHVNVASPTAYTDTSPWRCHNCSCGTRVVEKPTRYLKRTWTLPTEGSVIASWRSVASITLLAKRAYVSVRSSFTFISLLWRFGPYSGHGSPLVFILQFCPFFATDFQFHTWRRETASSCTLSSRLLRRVRTGQFPPKLPPKFYTYFACNNKASMVWLFYTLCHLTLTCISKTKRFITYIAQYNMFHLFNSNHTT